MKVEIPSPDIKIRKATAEDAALILGFITDLAIYERAEEEVVATESDIRHSLFGNNTNASAVICNIGNDAVGFAVYFYSYSTWLGKNVLFLEDLYVSPQYRGSGAGKALLKYLAKKALSKNCGRFEWNVLDWNEPAIKFYQALGAKPQNEWVGYRLTGKSLEELAKS
jgi:GNAT superfamily N-acetyltransferase